MGKRRKSNRGARATRLGQEVNRLNEENTLLKESKDRAWDYAKKKMDECCDAEARVSWLQEKIRVDRNVGLFFSSLLIVLNLVLLWFLL